MSAFAAEPRRAGVAVPGWVSSAAALLAVAVAIQIGFGMMADVSWLIQANETWLAGAVPYRDIIEVNPPASLLLYTPAVALAHALGLPPEGVVSAFGFAASGAAIGLGALILRGSRAARAPLLLSAIVALTLLPGQTFCQRDHLAAVFGVPLLALALARAERLAVAAPLALLAGLGAGAMVAIKPPYALIPALLALYQLRRSGWRAVLQSPEYYAAAALCLTYLALVRLLFPAYVELEMGPAVDVYVKLRLPMAKLVASPGALIAFLILACAALTAGDRIRSPGFIVAGLAAAGAGVAFFVQGKGWVYHAAPAMMFATLAAPFALGDRSGRAWPPLVLAAAAAAIAASLLHNLGGGWAIGAAIGVACQAALSRQTAFSLDRLAPFAFAAAVGAALGLCTIERPLTPALEATLAGFGPNLKLATISEDEGLAFPLVRRLRDRWIMRANGLALTAGVRRLLSEHPGDAALAQRIAPYAARERVVLLEDIARGKPDALLVGPLDTRLHADLFADPALQGAMADYVRVGVEHGPDMDAELWLRRDGAASPIKALGLRP